MIVLISSYNACAADFQEKMRGINLAMRAQKMPPPLQMRSAATRGAPSISPSSREPTRAPARRSVKRFYEFQWHLQRGANTDFLRELPEGLRTEVAVSQHAKRLKKVPMFAACHRYVIIKLAERLQTMFAMAGDEVCKQGMVGHSMYFIETGVVTIHVLQKPKSKATAACRTSSGEAGSNEPVEIEVGTLTIGDFFGEMALLSTKTIQGIFNNSRRRRCTVRAKTMCTLQVCAPLPPGDSRGAARVARRDGTRAPAACTSSWRARCSGGGASC